MDFAVLPKAQITGRAVGVGLIVGVIMCMSNMYFGLQTGWITMGSLQSAILGFGFFRALQQIGFGQNFTVAENVIVQVLFCRLTQLCNTPNES